MGYKIRNMGYGVQEIEYEKWDVGYGIRVVKMVHEIYGIRNVQNIK